MTEDEYLEATDLARMRAVVAILRECYDDRCRAILRDAAILADGMAEEMDELEESE